MCFIVISDVFLCTYLYNYIIGIIHEHNIFNSLSTRQELGAHIAILGCAESTVPFYQRLGWEICPDAEQLYSPLGTDSCQKLPWVDKILVRMVGDRDDIQIQMDIDRFRNAQTLNVHGLPI